MPKVPTGLGAALPEDMNSDGSTKIVYLPMEVPNTLKPYVFNPKKIRRKKGKYVNTGIEYRILRLRQYRRDVIRDTGEAPIRAIAILMPEFKIDRKTVMKHAPELWARWDDIEYDMEDNIE